MKQSRLLSVLLALALLFGTLLAGDAVFAEEDPIMIGVISPNTGALAAYGTGIVMGADLAVEEINAAGGILGREVQLIKTDDQSDPTECLNSFNSLVAKGIGLIVGSATSGCTSAITDAANEEEVCILSPTATADSITTEDDFIFRACYADSFQGAIAAAYAKQAGFDRVGIVYCAADVYSKGLFDSFSKACEEYGIEVAAAQSSASLDVQDYTNQFAAMVNAGVEFVYAPYYYDVIGPYVVPQARAAGYTGIIMGADGYDTTKLQTQCGGINYCIKKIYEKSPKAKILFFTSIKCFRKPNVGTNPYYKGSHGLNRFVEAQIACCKRWGIPYLDQFTEAPFNEYNFSSYVKKDRLHLNTEGYKAIMNMQATFIAEH